MIKRRLRSEDFVSDFYSKKRYWEACTPHIRPMTGLKHWERTNLEQPLPPTIKKMFGRPSKKKRKKEAGEEEEARFLKRSKKLNKCPNCQQPWHNKVKCKKPPVAKECKKGGRPFSTDPWVTA